MEGAISKSRLAFYEIKPEEQNLTLPPPKVNGGRYTGAPALPNAPWGAFPVTPESHIYLQDTLAPNHIPGGVRLGNNKTTFPNHRYFDQQNYAHIMCAPQSH